MKKRSFGLAVCLVWLTAVWASAAPKLVVDEPVFEFGPVPQGQDVRHTFQFRNIGDEPLVISKVRSSCGCTAALVSSDVLQSGQQGELKTNFDSARFRGKVDKTIYLYSNDPQIPVQKMTVKGEVLELFGLAPRQVNFGPVQPEHPVERTVTLTSRVAENLQRVSIQTTSPQLKARFPDQLPALGSGKIKIALKPKPGQNRFSGYVILQLQGENTYDLRLPVYAQIRD